MNSKEENSEDFCLNYVQEFGLWRKHLQSTSYNELEHVLLHELESYTGYHK